MLIIKNCIPNKPLKPSIKFAPLIINKKHKIKKIFKKILFSSQLAKKIKSIWVKPKLKVGKTNIISDSTGSKIKNINANINLKWKKVLEF